MSDEAELKQAVDGLKRDAKRFSLAMLAAVLHMVVSVPAAWFIVKAWSIGMEPAGAPAIDMTAALTVVLLFNVAKQKRGDRRQDVEWSFGYEVWRMVGRLAMWALACGSVAVYAWILR